MKIEPFKMKVTSKQSRKVQEILFKNGYNWFINGETNVKHLNSPYLFFTQSIILGETQPNLTKGDFAFTFYENDAPKLTYQEFIDKYEFELPERWCIKINSDNIDTIKKWIHSRPDFDSDYLVRMRGFALSDCNIDKSYQNWSSNKPSEYIEITFEQFKKYVLKEETMDKKIIGYKLIKLEYYEAACKIGDTNLKSRLGENIAIADSTTDALKEAGVLDLWFEPIYKEEKFKVEDWVTVVNYIEGDSLGVKDFKIGDVFQIKEIKPSAHPNVGLWVSTLNKGRKNTISIHSLRKATPEEIKAAQVVKMPFGNIEVVVDPHSVVYTPEAVKIPFKDIRTLMAHWDYEMSTGEPGYHRVFITDQAIIQVGCMKGTFKQLLDIYNKMKELRDET